MRKIILNLAVSLDGFIEGPNGETDWCLTDQDYGMEAFFASTDAIFMGRKSYDLIDGLPSPFADKQLYVFTDSPFIIPNRKIVVVSSKRFLKDVQGIREQPGDNIWLFGGATLLSSFIKHKLISEFIISVHPVVLGGGTPLFHDISEKLDLLLLASETFSSGLIQLKYAIKPKFDFSILDQQLSSLN
ncbi:dihydrofolate reductase family protein [Mucilaginibacter sp. UR6-11]|uniref:dihydrofolate reductase family protein n=1 Tax=Mucilaginibacter sp. UR6-11 TaxID=1435644 RepID=UPI001E34DAC7|nr:dihydrofolate reductase family protein [Mucilaginibacter sp. UR6-11]MCC8427128.1 dihydrofolate reductase family protein [Mucilaginibacter sp. UR6-11]